MGRLIRRLRRHKQYGSPFRRRTGHFWQALGTLAAVAGVVVTVIIAVAGGAEDRPTPEPNDFVHVSVVEEPMVDDDWIAPVDRTRGERPPPPGDCELSDIRRRAAWFARHGGAPAGAERFRVEVVNDSDRTMVINGLAVKRLTRLPPIKGTGVTLCPGEGGPFDTQYALINLDERPPRVAYRDANFEPIRAVDFAPEPHQPLRFWVQANAIKRRYRWTAILEYSLDGRRHEVEIRNAGKPFEVSGCSFKTGVCRSPAPHG